MELLKGKTIEPRKTLVYADSGGGKTTLAAGAPRAVIMDYEGGANDIDCTKTPRIKTYHDTLTILQQIQTENIGLQTLVIDSLDWLQTIIWQFVSDEAGVKSIAEISYGQGYKLALAYWQHIVSELERIRLNQNVGIVLLCHSEIKRFEDPAGSSYDRWQPKLHAAAAALFTEYVDEILYCDLETFTKTEDEGFGRKRTRGTTSGRRVLRTTACPAWVAKNRLSMPDTIDCSWEAYQAYFPTAAAVKTERTK